MSSQKQQQVIIIDLAEKIGRLILKYIILLAVILPTLQAQPIKENSLMSVPMIKTDRCNLSALTLEDAVDLFKLASNIEVARYTCVFGYVHSNVEQTDKWIKKELANYEKRKVFPWIIRDKITNQFIGLIHIFDYDIYNQRADIGYYLLPEYWNRGLATEVVKPVISYGLDQLHLSRLQATSDPKNAASIKIIEKCGMKFEGQLRNYYRVNGISCDRNIYSITVSDYYIANK